MPRIRATLALFPRETAPVEETDGNPSAGGTWAKLGRHSVHVYDGNGAYSNPAIKPTLMRAIKPTRFHQLSQPDRVA